MNDKRGEVKLKWKRELAGGAIEKWPGFILRMQTESSFGHRLDPFAAPQSRILAWTRFLDRILVCGLKSARDSRIIPISEITIDRAEARN